MNRTGLLAWTISVVGAIPVLFVLSVGLWLWALRSFDGHWLRGSAFAILAGVLALLVLAAVMEVRSLARRWNSPLFYPTIWTCATGIVAAAFIYVLTGQPWNGRTTECIDNLPCTSSTHFEVSALAITLIFGVLLLGPFVGSSLELLSALKTPRARFVYRRWRH